MPSDDIATLQAIVYHMPRKSVSIPAAELLEIVQQRDALEAEKEAATARGCRYGPGYHRRGQHIVELERVITERNQEIAALAARCEQFQRSLTLYSTEMRYHAVDTIETMYRLDLVDALQRMLDGTWGPESHVHTWLAQIGPEQAAEFLIQGDTEPVEEPS